MFPPSVRADERYRDPYCRDEAADPREGLKDSGWVGAVLEVYVSTPALPTPMRHAGPPFFPRAYAGSHTELRRWAGGSTGPPASPAQTGTWA